MNLKLCVFKKKNKFYIKTDKTFLSWDYIISELKCTEGESSIYHVSILHFSIYTL